MAQKAVDPRTPESSYKDFKKVIDNEISILEECQTSGERLTILYRKNIGLQEYY